MARGPMISTLLRVAYDGGGFHGFARQPGLRTVQGELEAALQAIYRLPVLTRGASRTDAGVHALGQVIAFDPPFAIPDAGLRRALAGKLPPDLVARDVWGEAGDDGQPVQPRFANAGKHYRYRIHLAPVADPLTRRYVWPLARDVDVAAMRRAAAAFVGEHDFAAFRAADCQATTTIRRVTAVEITSHPLVHPLAAWPDACELHVDVHGDAFLKRMVRIMVGTLVEVGWGNRLPDGIAPLLRGSERHLAGRTAPAEGLVLVEVRWPGR
ncbi:MAG: tRNA pseudouridine(38-40) synthase TruA [Myxococcales bacterium FL481]|nr:MAG: tRNA pseudouridine(38-40) synthase TruA [Myxococcales bacterium FL481]